MEEKDADNTRKVLCKSFIRHGSHLANFWKNLFTLRSKSVIGTHCQVGKNFENREKHKRRRIAWVAQADFGKLELNNRNNSEHRDQGMRKMVAYKRLKTMENH